jgi:hypothetical protein
MFIEMLIRLAKSLIILPCHCIFAGPFLFLNKALCVPSFYMDCLGAHNNNIAAVKAAYSWHNCVSQVELVRFILSLCCCLNTHIYIRTSYPSNLVWTHIYYHHILQARFLFVLLSCFSFFQLGMGHIVDCFAAAASAWTGASNIRSHREPTLAALDRWACCCSRSWKVEMC